MSAMSMTSMCQNKSTPCTATAPEDGRGGHEEVHPLISYAPSTTAGTPFDTVRVARVTSRESEADLGALGSDTASARMRFIHQAHFESVREKLKLGKEVKKEEMQRIFSVDEIPDEAYVLPVVLGPGSDGFEEIMRKHGPRGAATSVVAARERCEANGSSEAVTAKEFRAMAHEADNLLKPLLLVYLTLSAVGGGVLLSATKDASPPFVAATLLHLAPESFLWSYLLFGGEAGLTDRRWPLRWGVRLLYIAGQIFVLVSYGLQIDGMASPALGVYCTLSGVSDAVCLMLGVFYYFYRLDVCMRRLGTGLFGHGLAAQLCAVGYLNPALFEQDGTEELHNWGWFLMVISTFFSFLVIVPIFRAKNLHIRAQQPSPLAAGIILGGAVLSLLMLPLLAGTGYGELMDELMHPKPSFLPRGWLLLAYKVTSSVGGLVLVIHVITEYGLASRKLLAPTFTELVKSLCSSGSSGSSQKWLSSPEDTTASRFNLNCCSGGSGGSTSPRDDATASLTDATRRII